VIIGVNLGLHRQNPSKKRLPEGVRKRV
jgi:hypothetical protein